MWADPAPRVGGDHRWWRGRVRVATQAPYLRDGEGRPWAQALAVYSEVESEFRVWAYPSFLAGRCSREMEAVCVACEHRARQNAIHNQRGSCDAAGAPASVFKFPYTATVIMMSTQITAAPLVTGNHDLQLEYLRTSTLSRKQHPE